ncbi:MULTISPECIES: putative leader peptide [unclassified Streptomyces]|uniref:putative leader peptide n=1 Tax=Streptomyces sp. NPDC127129 TaxID=3345373 RepID=UPI00363A079B
MSLHSACETQPDATLTRPVFAASLLAVSTFENFSARLHVDLRRQASAICAVGR